MNQLPQFNELGEPSEQDNPVPLVIILLIASLVVWGAMYIFNVSLYIEDKVSARVVNYGTVQQEPASAPAPAPAKETPAASPSGGGEGAGGAVTANGKSVYAGKCAACHQATGKGLPGVFPPLDGSEWVTTDNIDIPLQIVLHGIKGSIMVNGTKYSGAMPAFAPTCLMTRRLRWSTTSAQAGQTVRLSHAGRCEKGQGCTLFNVCRG